MRARQSSSLATPDFAGVLRGVVLVLGTWATAACSSPRVTDRTLAALQSGSVHFFDPASPTVAAGPTNTGNTLRAVARRAVALMCGAAGAGACASSPTDAAAAPVVPSEQTRLAAVASAAARPKTFGLHMHRFGDTQRPTPWPTVRYGAWRLHDADGVFWFDVQPARDSFDFRRLDQYVAAASTNGVEVLLTLGQTPAWASARPSEPGAYGRPGSAAEPLDLGAWEQYVRAVASRYKGRIAGYEVWNEPNLRQFYTGDVRTMVAMARIAHETVKAVDPAAVLVSPSPTGWSGGGDWGRGGLDWMADYLAQGGGAYADVIGYHLYGASPEGQVAPLARRVQRVLADAGVSKPVWNTEIGWCTVAPTTPYQNTGFDLCDAPERRISPSTVADYVLRTYILLDAAGVERTYWYSWDNGFMGISSGAPLRAYSTVIDWLGSRAVSACTGTTFLTCEARDRAGREAHFIWSTVGDTTFTVPAGWGAAMIRTVDGHTVRVDSRPIAVGSQPILVE